MAHILIILGTGGRALDVADEVDSLNSDGDVWETFGFLDDSKLVGSQHMGLPIFGPLSGQMLRNISTVCSSIPSAVSVILDLVRR